MIRGVMGPDEFHSGYPGQPEEGIDNTAYTNVMAAWTLLRALDTLDVLPPHVATSSWISCSSRPTTSTGGATSRLGCSSPCTATVHAWVLARSRRERATELFVRTLESDVADIQGGTTAEGVHLAAMAGSVDLLQRCFSGLEVRGDRLILRPYWPEGLGRLEFGIQYREQALTLQISGSAVEISAGSSLHEPITVMCRDEQARLRAGSRVRFPLQNANR